MDSINELFYTRANRTIVKKEIRIQNIIIKFKRPQFCIKDLFKYSIINGNYFLRNPIRVRGTMIRNFISASLEIKRFDIQNCGKRKARIEFFFGR